MKNKTQGILCFFLILVLSINFSLAALNETQVTEKTNQAYSWLNSITLGNSSKFSSQDNSFLLLSLAYDTQLASELKNSLLSQSSSNECWPKPKDSCKVLDTSLAALSLQRICNSNVDIDNWILNQTATPSELIWYLQVHASGNASCTISYGGADHNFKLSDNNKIDKSAGSCLSLSNDNYWFKVAPSCYDKTFSVTCTLGNAQDQFLTAWLYQKPADIAYYVSSDTQKESSGGVIDVGINAKCFKSGTSCDYESTAWAAFYLLKGHDIGVFLPYLIGYADKNSAKLPEAFLYVLTGEENYADQLLAKQKSTGYWQATTTNDKYYDTALALMALKDYTSASELTDKAKSWLIKEAKSEKINNQVTYVSWGTSKKYTAFILYSVWPKKPSCIYLTPLGCEEMGFDCVMTDSCEDGETVDYFCTYASKVCCKQVIVKKTCSQLNGDLCGYGETCEGKSEYTDEGTCCLGTCVKTAPEKTDCEKKYNICLSSIYCGEGYNETADDCGGGKICCEKIEVTPEKNLKWLWILIGVILIVALILLFLNYQKKKSVSGFKPRPSQGSGGYPPYSPPASGGARRQQPAPQFRTMIPARGIPIRQPVSRSQTDKELDDTLKRVRQIAG